MTSLFAPYCGKEPATLSIKGHRMVILCPEKDNLIVNLDMFKADQVKEVVFSGSLGEQEEVLADLARSINGGVVVAPVDIEFEDLLEELEAELPWVN